jgi:hypothetical protein
MRENLFQRFLKRDEKFFVSSVEKRILSKRRKRTIIPEEYFIEVITTVPERKAVVEYFDN